MQNRIVTETFPEVKNSRARSAWLYILRLYLKKQLLAQDPLLGYVRRAGRRSGKTSGDSSFGSCFPGGGSRELENLAHVCWKVVGKCSRKL